FPSIASFEMSSMSLTRQASGIARLNTLLSSFNRSLVAMFDQGIVSGLSFATSILVGRVAGKSELGLYALGMSIVLFSISLQQSLVSAPHTIFVIRKQDVDQKQYNGSMIALAALIMCIMATILISATMVVAWGTHQSELSPVFAAVAIVGPAVLFREFSRKFLYAFKEVSSALLLDSLIALAQISLLVAFIGTGQLTGITGLFAIGLACLLTCSVWFYRNRQQFSFSWAGLRHDLRQSWNFGRWVFAGQMCMASIGVALNWILVSIGGTEANGAYGACMMLILLANPFVLGIQNLLSPAMASAMHRQGGSEVKRLVVQSTLKLGTVMAGFAVVISIFGNWLITVIYGPEYSGQNVAILFLALGSLALAFGVSSNHGLRSIERPELNFAATAIGLTVAIGTACWLIPTYSVLGAAISYFAANLVIAIVRFTCFILAANRITNQVVA
ncbi:MAG: polysaccharide biosynthesis C-terminal domain-containing protein, partial [Planctomycetota bacterium]